MYVGNFSLCCMWAGHTRFYWKYDGHKSMTPPSTVSRSKRMEGIDLGGSWNTSCDMISIWIYTHDRMKIEFWKSLKRLIRAIVHTVGIQMDHNALNGTPCNCLGASFSVAHSQDRPRKELWSSTSGSTTFEVIWHSRFLQMAWCKPENPNLFTQTCRSGLSL